MTGLGDLVARVLKWLGIQSSMSCGCNRRRQWLNQKFPFRRPPKRPPHW